MSETRSRAAWIALITVIGLIGIKLAVGITTGSLSILAQAADSFLDLMEIILALWALRMAIQPADEEHAFGHGKIENLAAVIQGSLIFVAGISIIYSAIRRFIEGATIELAIDGIAVMAVSIIASILLSRYLRRVSADSDSLLLGAMAKNISADVYSAAGVLAGMVVIYFTGMAILDPIIALAISGVIIMSAISVFRESFGGLVDTSLPGVEEEIIKSLLNEHNKSIVGFHKLRTRKAGRERFVDLHLLMQPDISLREAHDMASHLEADLKEKFGDISIVIHVEPCEYQCEQCQLECPYRRAPGPGG